MQFCFLAMVLYPEVQAKLQTRIDSIVGSERLPEFDDLPSMPYLDATILETLRHYPVFPMGVYIKWLQGVPILMLTTISYAPPKPWGWRVQRLSYPKGLDCYRKYLVRYSADRCYSTNIHLRAMSYNEEVYPEPEVFRPDRYLNLTKTEVDAIDPRNFIFGFGRRYAKFCCSYRRRAYLLLAEFAQGDGSQMIIYS